MPDTIVNRWNDVVLAALEIGTNEKPLRLGPPQVSRLLAMIYTAAFQAWAPYSDTATPPLPGGPNRRPANDRTLANKEVAISHAIYRTSLNLMPHPSLKALLDAQMTALDLEIGNAGTNGNSPEAIGNNAAKLVIQSRANDGSNQAGTMPGSPSPPSGGQPEPYADYSGYQPVNAPALAFGATARRHIVDPARWQPLSYIDPGDGVVATPKFITPFWGQVTPFALTSGDQFRPSPPEVLH